MTIYKKIITAVLLFLLFNTFTFLPSQASMMDGNGDVYKTLNYSALNSKKIREEAQKDFFLYFRTSDIVLKEKYLNTAMQKYYILTQIDPSDIDA